MLQYGQPRIRYARGQNPGKPGVPIVYGTEESRSNAMAPWVPWRTLTAPSVLPGTHWGKACMDELHKGPPYRTGGKLRLVHVGFPGYGQVSGRGVYIHVDGNERLVTGFSPSSNAIYWGSPSVDFNWPSDANLSLGSGNPYFPPIGNYGQKGWAKAKPKLEQASGFVFGAELRELPRMLGTTAKGFADAWHDIKSVRRHIDNPSTYLDVRMSPKAAANQFLNQQFGWRPFIGDILKFDDVYRNGSKYIQKLTDENGRSVRHRVTVAEEETTSIVGSGGGTFNSVSYAMPCWPVSIPSGYFMSPPKWWCEDVTKTKVTAVGKFTYYRPEFDASKKDYSSLWNRGMRQLTMYGIRISPSNLYKIMPWSWAADWAGDVGTYVDYASDVLLDSLSAEYFYLMMHQRRARRLNVLLPFHSGTVALSWDRFIETKQRVPGSSPFSFDLSWNSLSPRQLAIAAALGISRW